MTSACSKESGRTRWTRCGATSSTTALPGRTSATKMLDISDLHATVAGKPILNGVTLHVPAGEVHAIMGPNGSGKSTLAYVLSGRPGYEVTDGSATFDGQDLVAMEPHERAAA